MLGLIHVMVETNLLRDLLAHGSVKASMLCPLPSPWLLPR